MPVSDKIAQYFRKTNHVIIHYHIFKNAGSTVDAVLQRNFGEACGSFEGDSLAFVVTPESLLNYIVCNPHLKVISSHNARLPVPKHRRISFYPLIFLRHPIDRIGSMYAFERRQPHGTTLTSDFARENSFAEYVQHFLHKSTFFLKNYQTLHFSGREMREKLKAPAVMADLEIALERLRNLAFLGIVEYFDESLLLMQDYLQKSFGPIDISYSIINKSTNREASLETRLDRISNELGPDLYSELMENNMLDLELYKTATNLFKERTGRKDRH